MSEELIVREAKPGDAAALARLIGQLGYEVTAEEVSERLGQLADPCCWTFVGIKGEAIAGCLTTSRMQVIHRPAPVGRISMMVVDEAQRSGGIGAAMVREAERRLAEGGCYMVEITSHQTRLRAHRFWESCGYEKTSVRLAKTL